MALEPRGVSREGEEENREYREMMKRFILAALSGTTYLWFKLD